MCSVSLLSVLHLLLPQFQTGMCMSLQEKADSRLPGLSAEGDASGVSVRPAEARSWQGAAQQAEEMGCARDCTWQLRFHPWQVCSFISSAPASVWTVNRGCCWESVAHPFSFERWWVQVTEQEEENNFFLSWLLLMVPFHASTFVFHEHLFIQSILILWLLIWFVQLNMYTKKTMLLFHWDHSDGVLLGIVVFLGKAEEVTGESCNLYP